MRIIVLAVVTILTFDVFAGKPAWKLTPEERAVSRADPLGRAERQRLCALDGRYPVDAQDDVVEAPSRAHGHPAVHVHPEGCR
jgi:hypothetical protein